MSEFKYNLKENEEFKLTLTPLWETSNGSLKFTVNEKTLENLAKLKVGDVAYVNTGFTLDDGTEIRPKIQAVRYKNKKSADDYADV